jgi:hypothetical protein
MIIIMTDDYGGGGGYDKTQKNTYLTVISSFWFPDCIYISTKLSSK